MPNEQTHSTEEIIPNKETDEEVSSDAAAKQTLTEEDRFAFGSSLDGNVNFAQMYDMLTERDKQIKDLSSEISSLKKTNTELLLKVNASSSASSVKNPYEAFVDAMVNR